jgi:hypothetical protein
VPIWKNAVLVKNLQTVWPNYAVPVLTADRHLPTDRHLAGEPATWKFLEVGAGKTGVVAGISPRCTSSVGPQVPTGSCPAMGSWQSAPSIELTGSLQTKAANKESLWSPFYILKSLPTFAGKQTHFPSTDWLSIRKRKTTG